MSLVDNNLPAPGTTNTPPPVNQPPSPPAASAVAAASGSGGLLSRGSPPAASGGSGVIPSAASGGGSTTIPGLGTWQGTGWSGSGNVNGQGYGGNQPADGGGGGGGGAGPSWGGETVGGGAAFDDGGSVSDSGDTNSSPSLDDALSTIKDTLNYGRQQAGMGQQANAAPQGQGAQSGVIPSKPNDPNDPHDETYQENIDDQSPGNVTTGPAMSMYGLSGAAQGMSNARKMMGFADGGDVDDPSAEGMPAQPQTNQPAPQPGALQPQAGQPQQGQPGPPKLVGYVMGAGAVSPDIARALEAKVDPQGTMDPTTRKMLAIQAAPDQQTKWGLMQNYRQQFNAHASFARAAATGTPQKPADMAAAAKAATDAFSNIPDGTQTTFQPTQGGVVAHIHHLTGGKKVMAHDDGGDVGNPMDEPAAIGENEQPDTSTPGKGKGVLGDTGSAKGDQTSAGNDTSQQDQSVPLSGPGLSAVLSKLPWDATMDKGAAETLNQYATTQNEAQQQKDFPSADWGTSPDKTISPAKAAQIKAFNGPSPYQLSPNASQAQKDAFNAAPANTPPERVGTYGQFAGDENGRVPGVNVVAGSTQRAQPGETQKNAIALQQEKNKGLEAVGGLRAGATEGAAQTRATASTQNSMRTNSARLQQELIRATGGVFNAGSAALVKAHDALIAGGITDPNQIAARLAPLAAQNGLNYQQWRQIMQNSLQPQQGQPTAAQPTGQTRTPPPEAIQILKNDPSQRAHFDNTFGPGSAAQVLGQ